MLLFTSCNNNQKEELITIDANFNTLKNSTLSDFFDLEIIKLERNEFSLIGKISKVVIKDSLLYILDRDIAKKIFIFSLEGKFIKTIGVIGKGKGEYIRLKDICLFNEYLYLLAGPDKKIIQYDLGGNFISEIRLNKHGGYFLEFMSNQNFLSMVQNTLLSVSFWNNKGKEIDSYEMPKYSFMRFIPEKPLSKLNKEIFIHTTYNDTIYKVLDNCRLEPRYVFNYYDESFPTNRINNKEEFISEKKTMKYIHLIGFVNSDKYIFTAFRKYKSKNYGFYDKEMSKYFYIPKAHFQDIPLFNLVGEFSKGIMFSTPAWVVNNSLTGQEKKFQELTQISNLDNPILFILRHKD